MFFRPALNDNLLVSVKLDGVAPLAVEIAEKAVLPSAKRKVSHGRGNPNVNADVTGRRFIAEAPRRRSARREQRRLISISAAFQKRQRFVHTVGVNQAEHGP